MKASASKEKRLLRHTGKAVVFAGSADLARRIDDPQLDVEPGSVLILQNIGPVGNPGMPEAGLIPIPRKLAEKGVTDMLRLSDGRMSGTAGGTICLHISPEAADPNSTLGILQSGDIISLDVNERRIHVELTDEEIAGRVEQRKATLLREGSTAPWAAKEHVRGYRGLYMREVLQAEQGADFDFLTAEGPKRS
jgi:dihydroxy-acid dehydratase